LLDYVRAGDVVVVVALDRLGRSLSSVIRTIETLTETGVLLRSSPARSRPPSTPAPRPARSAASSSPSQGASPAPHAG